MEKTEQIYSQRRRLFNLSLKKNNAQRKIVNNREGSNAVNTSNVIVLDESFERLRSDFPKPRLSPHKIYSPIVIDDSYEYSEEELQENDRNKLPSKSGNVSLNLSSSSTRQNRLPSAQGWSPAQDIFSTTPTREPEPSTPTDVLNKSQEHCSLDRIQKSHHKLLRDLYGDIWKDAAKFMIPLTGRKLIYDDEDEKENITSEIEKNRVLYLTDSERKKIKSTALLEIDEKKSKKKLYTEKVPSTPDVPKPKPNKLREVQTTLKKKLTKGITGTEVVQIMNGGSVDRLKDVNRNELDTGSNKVLNKVLGPTNTNTRSNLTEKTQKVNTQKGKDLTKKIKTATLKTKDHHVENVTRKLNNLDVCHTPETKRLSFMASLADNVPHWRCHPEVLQYHDRYKSLREQLAQRMFKEFNQNVFGDKLDQDMPITWDTKLRSTAGTTTNRLIKKSSGQQLRVSSIKLSCKVLDTPQRARDTLIHELCHAATWQIDGELRAGHGPLWVKWCKMALRVFPELGEISRCHDLEIHFKYCYKCTQCGYSVKRHSKSIDITAKLCGYCRGRFEIIVNKKDKNGVVVSTPARTGNMNEFALYVKENYSTVKAGRTHAQVMKILGEQFSAKKKPKHD
ncbi:unnamed protein product [Leptosia nina]|uniref:SprT-like domain-containing protein n=1 Tax=Leptosia nina TaxID=320188 RepID=A0AAV1JBW5_9NEOP